MSKDPVSAGVHTEAEISSQPRCWSDCLRVLQRGGQIDAIAHQFSSRREWLFTGCGSSYYLALAAAASWTELTGQPSRGVPASELLLFPGLISNAGAPLAAVLFSRSGHTSEVLEAANYLNSRNVPMIAFTCAPGQPLEQVSSATVLLAPADEKSTVMTRSFTSMLLGLQFLAATLANNAVFLSSLDRLPASLEVAFGSMASSIQSFVREHDFADYVCLGQGPFYGLACEAALKVNEMSCSYAQCFHTLEFRHGPKAIVGPDVLITFLLSDAGFDAERKVLEDVKALGGSTLVVTNQGDEAMRDLSDLLIELHLEANQYARLAASIVPGQLLGFHTGVKKGLNPDKPRHLSRVVILEDRS
jgi:glutamine---fructose-6-phosphate transaminase (isomerizing)